MTKPQRVTLDGVEHNASTFTPEQKHLLDHCVDLDIKLFKMQFELQQLQVAKDAFLQMLKDNLGK